MPKFKIGDRFQVIKSEWNTPDVPVGSTGVVLTINTSPYVKMDYDKYNHYTNYSHDDSDVIIPISGCTLLHQNEMQLINI